MRDPLTTAVVRYDKIMAPFSLRIVQEEDGRLLHWFAYLTGLPYMVFSSLSVETLCLWYSLELEPASVSLHRVDAFIGRLLRFAVSAVFMVQFPDRGYGIQVDPEHHGYFGLCVEKCYRYHNSVKQRDSNSHHTEEIYGTGSGHRTHIYR